MNTLNILCFGDSLTRGYPSDHSYAWSLKSTLENTLKSSSIYTDEQGLDGDIVISPPGQFYPRMRDLYNNASTGYDWAIILGGTNDLYNDFEADPVFSALQRLWNVPISNETKVLALTILECGVCGEHFDEMRELLSEHILAHEQHNLYAFNLHEALPYWSLPKERREAIWYDGMHLTRKGYDLMGSLIAGRLAGLIDSIENGRSDDAVPAQHRLTVARSSESNMEHGGPDSKPWEM